MSQPPQVDFFVSYTSADRPWAEWIAWELEQAGHSVLIQAWDFAPGANWVLEMDQAARVSRRTLAVLSPAFLESPYAKPEWAAAFRDDPEGRERKLLPVRIRECNPEGLLGSVVYADLVGLPQNAALERLLSAAGATRLKPKERPSFPQERAGGQPAVERPSEGPPIWNVPTVAGRFVGREALLDHLAERLAEGDATALTQTQALHGLGGVGKTRAAAEYARRHRANYDVVWWVRSENQVTRLADYAALADALGLPERDQPDQEAQAVAVKWWLERNARWLLVFDNAPGPDGLPDLLPSDGGGHVLITSRQHGGWRGVAEACPVEVWSRSESVAFIQQRSGDRDPTVADAIADALGDLPLALEQAGAYVDSTQVSLAGYQQRLKDNAPALFSHGRPANYEHPVATTWDLAFAEVERDEACAALLFCCAYLAPERAPRELFVNEAVADGRFAARDGEIVLDDAIRRLLAFSLVTVQENSLSMHRLVQHVIRDRLSDQTWLALAERVVFDAFPDEGDDYRTWLECERLLPHALAVTVHARDTGVETPDTAALLSRAARYLTARFEFHTAEQLYGRTLAILENAYGPDHADVAITLGNLGIVLGSLGDLEGAREHQERALTLLEKEHGPDSPEFARMLANLGVVFDRLGELEAAREHEERALVIIEKAYGPDHPDVAIALGNLGDVVRRLGDLEGARELERRALAIAEKIHGPDHPEVARTLSHLGNVLWELGDLEGAREHNHRALAIEEDAYGPNHPEVARTLSNLGIVLKDLGDLETARDYQKRALAIMESAYGPAHPEVAKTLANLGEALEELGDSEGARHCWERATEITEGDSRGR